MQLVVKLKRKKTPSAGIMTIETDAKVNDDDDEMSMTEEFVEMMRMVEMTMKYPSK